MDNVNNPVREIHKLRELTDGLNSLECSIAALETAQGQLSRTCFKFSHTMGDGAAYDYAQFHMGKRLSQLKELRTRVLALWATQVRMLEDHDHNLVNIRYNVDTKAETTQALDELRVKLTKEED